MIAPDEPPPVKYVPAVTPVMSPTLVVNPASLLKSLSVISLTSFLLCTPLSSITYSNPSTVKNGTPAAGTARGPRARRRAQTGAAAGLTGCDLPHGP